jgi:phytol kinase
MNPWLGILLVLALLGLAFLLLRLFEKHRSPHPEVLRKLMHVPMGLITASFPWLFDQVWPVLLLAASSLAVLVLVRSGFSATRSVRGVLHGVERSSWGELLFPVSVALLFVLAQGDPLLYSVPILILALADAVAALIGVYYGQTQFKTLEGSKSIEGSFAFFIVAFLCVHVAVLLFTDTGRVESLLIGLLMGIIVMLFEAVAWRGLDNLFIPVASFALLKSYLDADAMDLSVRLVVILLLGVFLMFWRRRSTLDDSALIGAGLVAYGAWAVGDLYWLLVPVSVFVVATLLAQRMQADGRKPIHTVYALLSVAGPGLAWLVLNRNGGSADLFFAYAVAFSAHLTMFGVSYAHYGLGHLSVPRITPAILQGVGVLVLPYLLMWGLDWRLLTAVGLGTVLLASAGILFLRLQPALDDCPATADRWIRQALIAGGISLLAWLSVAVVGPGVLPG